MTTLVFCDTETTGLSLSDDIWEFAAVRREPSGEERSLHMFIKHAAWKREDMPDSFRQDLEKRYSDALAWHPRDAAVMIDAFFREGETKPHIVGAVPNFDTERLSLLLERYGFAPRWHYHLIDVENLIVGYLTAKGVDVPLPWNSDDLSRLIEVEPPTDARHTAMGDVRWTIENFDKVMNYG